MIAIQYFFVGLLILKSAIKYVISAIKKNPNPISKNKSSKTSAKNDKTNPIKIDIYERKVSLGEPETGMGA